jgi:serine/threonine-protein kinase
MTVVFGLGSLLKNRYLTRQVIAAHPVKKIYLVEDRLQSGELLILWEFNCKNTIPIDQLTAQLEQLKQISHAQIRQLKDYWFEEDERLFIIQSYLEGSSYQQIFANYTTSARDIQELFAGILPVLSYLHDQALYNHRITPDNLWRQPETNMPIMANLGITSDIESQLIGDRLPLPLNEQLDTLPIKFASEIDQDLYALAVTAILLLTKQDIPTLFDWNTQTWQWQQWRSIDPNLATILDRMLSPQIATRFKDANAICDLLDSLTIEESNTDLVDWKEETISITVNRERFFQNFRARYYQKLDRLNLFFLFILVTLVITSFMLAFRRPYQIYSNLASKSSLLNYQKFQPARYPQPSLSLKQAIASINQWQKAKQSLLHHPYDRSLAAEILTGKAYETNIKQPNGEESSVEWLENRSAYYVFGLQKIDQVQNFAVRGDRATLQVIITEQRTLYNKYDLPDVNSSGFDTNLVRYDLELDDGRWKIADYQVIN